MKAKKTNSGSYRIQIKYKDSNGKIKNKSITARTKLEVEQLAFDFKMNHTEESTLTLGQAMTAYVDSKSNILSPSTIREYRRAISREPDYMLSLPLSDIDNKLLQKEFNKRALTLSPKSLKNTRGFYSAVLKQARPDFRLIISLPQTVKVESYLPTQDDIQKLLELSDGELKKAIILAALGSLRRSEISALTKNDIKGNVITVNKAMVEDVNKQWVIKHPKTLAGNRKITLPSEAIKLLTSDSDRVVNLTPNQITRQFEKFVKRNFDFAFRFHDLRHYQASILHAMGVPELYIMKRGGWEDRKTLQKIYEYAFDDKLSEVNNQISDNFKVFFNER